MRGLLAALALAAALAPSAAAAAPPSQEYREADKPKRPAPAAPDGLRGSAPAAAAAPVDPKAPIVTRPSVAAIPPPRFTAGRPKDLGLTSPFLRQPSAPRITGWTGAESVGGAQCRTACYNDQYVCLAGDSGECGAVLSKCVAACPESSSDAL